MRAGCEVNLARYCVNGTGRLSLRFATSNHGETRWKYPFVQSPYHSQSISLAENSSDKHSPVQRPADVSPAVRQVQKFRGTLQRTWLSIRTGQAAWRTVVSATTSSRQMRARSSPVPFNRMAIAGSMPCSDAPYSTVSQFRPRPKVALTLGTPFNWT